MLAFIIAFLSCSSNKDPHNSLTEAEEKQHWQLLFDGQSLQGWHGYNEKKLPTAWRVKEGELQCIAKTLDLSHGDLVSDSLYGNFDLRFEWKIACLLYTSPSPRDATLSRMPSSA